MATQLSAVSKAVSSATSSGVLTVDTTNLLRVGQIGWLSKVGVTSRRIEITEIMSGTTVRATIMPRILDDNFARSMPLAYPTTNFLDLSEFNGAATFNAEAQVVSDLYTLPGQAGTLLDGVYGSITVSGAGSTWRITDGVYGDVTVSGAGTIWSVSFSDVTATWPQTTKRYYVANYLTGNDGNAGFSDVDLPSANAVAVKTIERLRQLVPQLGDGRDLVIVVAGDPAGTDLQYLKMDGITADDLDFRLTNYRNVVIRTSRTFLNDTADKTILGAATGVTGPGAGGVWTCDVGSTTSVINVTSATLPAEPGAIGMRVRFTGNITPALANQSRVIWMNTGGVITSGRAFTAAPAAGDTFYIERPGVLVNNINIQIHAGAGQNFGQLQTGLQIAGFRARQTDVNPRVYNWQCNELRMSFMELDQFLSMRAMAYVQIDHQYFDETGTVQTPGFGIRHAQNRSSVISGATNLIYNDSAVISSNVIYTFARVSSYNIGRGCYFAGRAALNFCGTGATNSTGIALFGADGSGQSARFIGPGSGATSSPLNINSSNGRFSGVDVSNAGASPAITVASMGGGYLHFLTLTSSAGGNTDVGISLATSGNTAAVASRLDIASTVTLTGTAGDLRLGDGTIVPYATVRASRYLDNLGNSVGNNTGTDAPVTRKTPGILANVAHQAADPTTPIIGDLWTRTDHRLASRGSDAITRYVWFTQTPVLAEWTITNTRYYFVDNVAGDDTRIGYVDAAHGTSWASSATGDAVSIKTLEELWLRIPKNGNGRRIKILIKGNQGAVSTYTMLKKDGVTTDNIDVRGIMPNTYAWFGLQASDFTNNTNDRCDFACRVAIAGPNGDSSFTVNSYASPTITTAGGALPSGSGLAGYKIRWKGNVTAGLRVRNSNAQEAPTATTLRTALIGTLPVANDEFFIERPSIRVGNILGPYGDLSSIPRSDNPTLSYGALLGGIEVRLDTIANAELLLGGCAIQACLFDWTGFTPTLSVGINMLNIAVSYVDETAALIATRCAFRWLATTLFVAGVGTSPKQNGASVMQSFGVVGALSVIGAVGFSFGSSSIVVGNLVFNNAISYSTLDDFFTTIGGTSTALALVVRGRVRFTGTQAVVRHVDVVNSAGNGIEVRGYNNLEFADLSGSSSGFGIDITVAKRCRIVLRTGVTITGTSGDINTDGGIVTLAQLAYLGFKDLSNSIFISTVGDEVTQGIKCTASGNLGLGDVVRISASGTAVLAQADSLANTQDTVGTVQNAALSGASCMVATSGIGLVKFNATPPVTPPAVVYLSSTVAGQAQTVAPAGSSNDIVKRKRIGRLIKPVAGQPYGLVQIQPDYDCLTTPPIADWSIANTRYVAVDPVAGDDTRIGYVDAPHGTSWASSATLDAVSVKTLEEVHQRIMPLNGNKRSLVILIKGNAAAATAIDVLNKAGTALDFIDVRGVVPWSYSYFSVRASNFMNDAVDIGQGARMIAYAGPNGDSSWTVASLSMPVITLSAGSLPTGNELAGLALRFKGNITAAIANRINVCKYAPTAGTLEYGGSSVTVPAANDEFFIEKPSVRLGMWVGNISCISRIKRPTITDTYAPWVSSLRLVLASTSVTGPTGSPHFMASVSGCVFDGLTNPQAPSLYLDYANMFSGRVLENGTDVSVFNSFRMESNFTTTMLNMGAANRADLSQVLYFGTTNAVNVKGSTQISINGSYIHGQLQMMGSLNEGNWPNLPTLGSTAAAARLVIRGGTNGIQLRNCPGMVIRFVSFIDLTGNAVDIFGTASSVDIGDCTSTNVAGYGINLASTNGTRVIVQNTTVPTGTLGDVNTAGGLVTYAQLAYLGFRDNLNNSVAMVTVGNEVTQGVKCTASGAIALGDVVRVTASGVATKAQADTAANATDVFGCAQNAAVNGATFMVVGAGHGLIGFTASPPTAPGIAYLSEATAGLCNTTAPATAGTNQKLRIGKLLRPIAGQPLAVCSIYPEYEPVTA